MEGDIKYMENPPIPQYLKINKMKLGFHEEGNKPAIMINNNKDMINNEQNTKERMQFLFPNLPPEDITKVLERSEYNIEKAIILIKEIKKQQNNSEEMEEKRKKMRGIVKRTYITSIQKKENDNNDNINSNNKPNLITDTQNVNASNNINSSNINNQIRLNNTLSNNSININNSNYNNNLSRPESTMNPILEENNLNNNNNGQRNEEISRNNEINNNNSIDGDRTNLINVQINFLLNQFSKMTDISQLRKLLIEIGFPVKKEEDNNKSKLEEMLKEKIKNNIEERKFIVNQYNKHNAMVKLIKQKEEKIDELTSSLANLIDAESEQKMREEEYKNELEQIANNLYNDNNNFNNPREGY